MELQQFRVRKATLVSFILHVLKNGLDIPEFAFTVGDDEADEVVFERAPTEEPFCPARWLR
uniref:Uncharacterized protein n=1 Tax=Hyaloperonospora arabidopsidis (strain Emoy2) TaxID=559515 RepID=M4C0A0_HYAAE